MVFAELRDGAYRYQENVVTYHQERTIACFVVLTDTR